MVAGASVLACLALSSWALAATAPIALDSPGNGSAPFVAYDPGTQTTYVAWSFDQGDSDAAVDLCVLPAGATACEDGVQSLTVAGAGSPGPYALLVLRGGEVAVIGEGSVFGAVAWVSPAGGAAFLTGNHGLQNGGAPISDVDIFRTPGNAVALNGTDVALSDTFHGFFVDTSLTAPAPAVPAPNANQNPTPAGAFGGRTELGNVPSIAAEQAPAPAAAGTDIVVGVGDNFNGPSIPGCVNGAGTGYGVSVGTVNGTSNAAGTLNAAGLPGYGLLACSALSPVLASGGTDGIGVLEQEGTTWDGLGSTDPIVYHPFNATPTGGSFGPGVQLVDAGPNADFGVNALDVVDDSGTGVYALWEDGQGNVLDYSANGGATWEPPTIAPSTTGGYPVIAGVGGGNVLVASVGNPSGAGNQVVVQEFDLAPAATPAADTITTTQTSGTSTGASITVPDGTTGETDKAAITGTNAATAGGTMIYGLFSSSSCSAGSLVFNGSTASVTNGVAGPSAAVATALAPGTYYWVAGYSGDSRNAASTSACGSEVLTIAPSTGGVGKPTIAGTATSTGTTVTVGLTITVVPITVTLTLTARNGTHGATITLGTGSYTLRQKGALKLGIRLRTAGRRLVAKDHRRLTARLSLTENIAGHKVVIAQTIRIT